MASPMRTPVLLTCISSLLLLALPAQSADPSFPKVSKKQAEESICFMHSSNGASFDLSALCSSGLSNSSSTSSQATSVTPTSAAAAASNTGGVCNFPDQLDSAGRRCGDRAASRRPGGYEPQTPVTYTPSTNTGGTIQVSGYTRKDGTYVKPYTRRR